MKLISNTYVLSLSLAELFLLFSLIFSFVPFGFEIPDSTSVLVELVDSQPLVFFLAFSDTAMQLFVQIFLLYLTKMLSLLVWIDDLPNHIRK